jgi:hypothetical protein
VLFTSCSLVADLLCRWANLASNYHRLSDECYFYFAEDTRDRVVHCGIPDAIMVISMICWFETPYFPLMVRILMALSLVCKAFNVTYPVSQRIGREPRFRIHLDFSVGMEDTSVAQRVRSTEMT